MSPDEDADAVTDEIRARAFAKFRCLRHRQTVVTFVPVSLTVQAANPSELEEAGARVWSQLAQASQPS